METKFKNPFVGYWGPVGISKRMLVSLHKIINRLRPRQNGRHFAVDVFKYISLNENVWILLKISLKCVPKGPINNIPSLFQVMVWRRPGDKQLSEPMMVSLLTHIFVAWPQWVNQVNPDYQGDCFCTVLVGTPLLTQCFHSRNNFSFPNNFPYLFPFWHYWWL